MLSADTLPRLRERPAQLATAELLAVLAPSATTPADMTANAIARMTADELAALPGIGPAIAARILAAIELGRRSTIPTDQARAIRAPADAANLLMYHLDNREQEYLFVLLLDTRNRIIGAPREVYHGSLNTSLIRIGEVFREAIRANAAAIVVAHNHPSGDPAPSPEDAAVTRALVEAGKLLDIEVIDHLVIAAGRFVSMKERGLGF